MKLNSEYSRVEAAESIASVSNQFLFSHCVVNGVDVDVNRDDDDAFLQAIISQYVVGSSQSIQFVSKIRETIEFQQIINKRSK